MFQLSNYLEESGRLAVADSAYRQSTNVMTPFPKPANDAQAAYQFAHVRTRTSVERTIGQLKNSQRCLLHTLNFSPEVGSIIFATTVAVHNIKKMTRNELIKLELLMSGHRDLGHQVPTGVPDPAGNTGADYRRLVAENCFSTPAE